MRIETKDGLRNLLGRYRKAKAGREWILTIEGCLKEGLPMDELDYRNTPRELKPLWRGLR